MEKLLYEVLSWKAENARPRFKPERSGSYHRSQNSPSTVIFPIAENVIQHFIFTSGRPPHRKFNLMKEEHGGKREVTIGGRFDREAETVPSISSALSLWV